MFAYFKDGLVNLYNMLANTRNAVNNNIVVAKRVPYEQLNEIYKLGIGNKIVRIKAGYSTKPNNIIFGNEEDKKFYYSRLNSKVKEATAWMIAFGRGVVVINDGADLSEPLDFNFDKNEVKFDVFSGDMVTVSEYETDLSSPNYLKPIYFNVRGVNIHYSRVIDFSYVKPTQLDAPIYQLGGISEFELIYNQLINDGIVERAGASILEKNSSLFYKIKGFKQALQSKQEEAIVKFYTYLENKRSIYGAGLLDSEDDVVNVSQSLSNLADVDTISLRRLAMVTGIPLALLVGENVKGLNSTGKQEKTIFNEMIEQLQSDYLLEPINKLLVLCNMHPIKFKENQNVTPLEKIEYEQVAIDNATKLYDLGFDVKKYLNDRGVDVKERDDFESEFPIDENTDLDLGLEGEE